MQVVYRITSAMIAGRTPNSVPGNELPPSRISTPENRVFRIGFALPKRQNKYLERCPHWFFARLPTFAILQPTLL